MEAKAKIVKQVKKNSNRKYKEDIDLLVSGKHYHPHRFLGLQTDEGGRSIIRLWRPGQEEVFLEVLGSRVQARPLRGGVFIFASEKQLAWNDYKVYHPSGILEFDPYAFPPSFGEEDEYFFNRGLHYEIYKMMGGRITTLQGVKGAKFVVWAPCAKQVSVVGDFNNWDSSIYPMRTLGSSGVWEIFIPGLTENTSYKFTIKTQQDYTRWKTDPYAVYMERRPHTASILSSIDDFVWEDDAWMKNRAEIDFRFLPMNIYEVHLASWKKGENEFVNYREIAPLLCDYCHEMGYTHIELLPVCEHPLDESWGYQVTGFYSITSRYGTINDFKYFVNYLHKNGIGVFLDWVPAHFPGDDYSLAWFDGSFLYEHEDPRKGIHPHWNTLIFNYGRYEVSNFLIGSALYWLESMHVDGLRVDAVASMLYLDYGRNEGEWIPNRYGGKENLEAIEFLKHLNSIVHQHCKGALMIAEESTAFLGVTHSLDWGGLGFDLKWNMGWMNDALRYFEKDPIYRKYHHGSLHFIFLYAFSEKYILVLSHDEVVHGKRNLISKMPGDIWQKFANLRLLLGFMICHPGKKLLFMGGEIAQWNEWYCKEGLHWFLLEYDTHRAYQYYVKTLNHFYLNCRPLWELDSDPKTLEWIDYGDANDSVICFFRRGQRSEVVCLFNFTPVYRESYFLRIPRVAKLREIFNSDSQEFGGSGKLAHTLSVQKGENGQVGFFIPLSPLAFQIFEVEFE